MDTIEIRRIPVIRTSVILASIVFVLSLVAAGISAALNLLAGGGDPSVVVLAAAIPILYVALYAWGSIAVSIVIYNWIAHAFAEITLEVETEDKPGNESNSR